MAAHPKQYEIEDNKWEGEKDAKGVLRKVSTQTSS